jgi:uncharacterized protein YlbG (UPF0298 family)
MWWQGNVSFSAATGCLRILLVFWSLCGRCFFPVVHDGTREGLAFFSKENRACSSMQVRYGILIYEAGDRMYIVVRVNVDSYGKMVHELDKHAGYYQVSAISLEAESIRSSPRGHKSFLRNGP